MSIYNLINWNKSLYQNNITNTEIVIAYLPFILVWCIYVSVIIHLWKKSEIIANKIVGINQLDSINIVLDYGNILSVGLIILGIYLIFDSLPKLFSYIANFVISKTRFVDKDFLREYTIKEIVEMTGIAIKIVMAFSIIKYNEKIVKKIKLMSENKSNVV
jgi:hypothetical protein